MVRVTVPATSANMGSGYDSIGIALEMYNVIDLAENDHIDISDKNGQFVPKDESNLIYQCAKRVYDECGKPLSGLTIVEDCAIPHARSGFVLGLHGRRHHGRERPARRAA